MGLESGVKVSTDFRHAMGGIEGTCLPIRITISMNETLFNPVRARRDLLESVRRLWRWIGVGGCVSPAMQVASRKGSLPSNAPCLYSVEHSCGRVMYVFELGGDRFSGDDGPRAPTP